MATTYGMTAPMMSSTMPNPMGTVQTAMAPSMMGQSPMGMNSANMNLPLSTARPIEVTETTPNLEEIQNFPVAGRAADGTHFHQDPVSGQMYRMSAELHDRIPEILRNRTMTSNNTFTIQTIGIILKPQKEAPEQPSVSINDQSIKSSTITGKSISSLFGINPQSLNMNDTVSTIPFSNDYYSLSLNGQIFGGRTESYLISEYIRPINIINNKSTLDILPVSSNYYKPTNLFLNVLSNQTNMMYSTSYFVPINKFINR